MGGAVGCLKCGNPRGRRGDALIVEVKAQYKRDDWNIKDESANPPRKHCIFPGGENFGLVSIQTLSLNLIRIGLVLMGIVISQFMTSTAMKGVTYVFPEVLLRT